MVTRRQYSDNDKAAALAALDANGGNLKRTARGCGIPVSTIKRWRDGEVNADVTELRPQKRAELIELFRDEIYEIFTELPLKRPDATYAQLATAAGIFNDKIQLLSGKATERTETTAKVEHTIDEPTTDRLVSIAAILHEIGAFPTEGVGDAADAPPE